MATPIGAADSNDPEPSYDPREDIFGAITILGSKPLTEVFVLQDVREVAEPGTHIASIVHVTDTHLFVDRAGVTKAPSERSRLVRLLARLGVEDLEYASSDAVVRLQELLTGAVAAERRSLDDGSPVVVVHSGDAEAFGASPGPDDFTGFSHLDSLFVAAAPDGVVAVYGNHDVWPGSVALFGLNGPAHRSQKQAIHRSADMVGELPPVSPPRFEVPHGPAITFVPLNTVHSSATRGGILANGHLSPHPPGSANVLDQLHNMCLRPTDLNIAVMHHPPHFDRPVTLRDRMGFGRLERSQSVAVQLREAGINLILSGHRHRLEPAFRESLDASLGGQPPLPPPMAQLVALSPTMHSHVGAADIDPQGTPRRGLCVYRLRVDGSGTSITIQRLIHDTDDLTPNGPTFEPAVVSHIRIGPQT